MANKMDTKKLEEQKRNAILELENRLATWKTFQNDYQALQEMLKYLPQKISHDVMVPFGSLAFMPGKLIHTNEILVLLGDNWFAKRSASQALEIVKRRQKYVEENIENLNKDLEFFSSQLNFTQEFENINKADSEIVEIKEEIKDDVKQKYGPRVAHERAKHFAPKRVKQFQPSKLKRMNEEDKELFAKLDRLEANETRNKELEHFSTFEEMKDEETVRHDTQSLQKKTEVKFADELEMNDGLDSDDSDESSNGKEEQVNVKTIKLNFTKPTSVCDTTNDQVSVASESGSITNPADIYRQYKPTPKSILKSTSTEKESVVNFEMPSHTTPSSRNNKEIEGTKAFSGKIIERSADSVPVQTASEAKPKRISRFKAERKKE